MTRRSTIAITVIVAAAACAIAVVSLWWSLDRAMAARLGPVYRFDAAANETFLTDDRAVEIARVVMRQDGLPESAWKLMEDDRTTAPDGRRDRYLIRYPDDPNRGMVYFHCDHTSTPQRFVHVEFRDRAITARGEFGK